MKIISTILILVLLGASNTFCQTNVPAGDLSGNWEKTNSPYVIEGNVVLPADKKLTIEAGVTIVFSGPFSFEIAGRVEALGNENELITFTINDTTGFAMGSFVGWSGIVFDGVNSNLTENSAFDHCIIEYAESSAITCVNYDHLLITNSIFRNNVGSGISLYEDSNIGIENISVINNGTIGFACINSSPNVNGFEINNNSGSGIHCSGMGSIGNPAIFTNGKVLYNITEYNGGGINLVDGAGVLIENVVVANNEGINGGGVYCHMSSVQLQDVTISDNYAENGGGIYSSYYVVLNTDHTLISGNHAIQDGGGIYTIESNVEILNATISDNLAGGQGGGVFYFSFNASNNAIRNSILWNNSPDEILSVIESPAVSYSNVMGGFEGEGNIDSDPMFENPYANDYSLQWNSFPEDNETKSPCIDMGDPVVSFDPDGTIADMGALFFNQDFYITTLEENTIGEEIVVYPNPVRNKLNVGNADSFVVVSIYSMTGEKVLEQGINSAFVDVDVSLLNTGFYTLTLQSKDGYMITRKFIKL